MSAKRLTDAGIAQRPEALLLDAGDTIVFFDPSSLAAPLRAAGVEVEPSRLEAALHPAKRHYQQQLTLGVSHMDGWSLLMCALLEHAGVEASRARELLPQLRAAHMEYNFWRRVPAGVTAALTRARVAGLRLGVVSNSEGKLRSLFERLGLAEHFELIVDSQLEGVQKPNPEIFRRALERMALRPERALYAGDIPEVDILGARAAGMNAVLVDATGHYRDQTQWVQMASVQELIDALLALPAHG
jgi:putative hydrolase of the HAD superfamily